MGIDILGMRAEHVDGAAVVGKGEQQIDLEARSYSERTLAVETVDLDPLLARERKIRPVDDDFLTGIELGIAAPVSKTAC